MVFYLKVNREKEYTITNLLHWIKAANIDEENIIYIVCDNENLKSTIFSEIPSIYLQKVKFLKSTYEPSALKGIVDSVALGTWKKIAYAHLTTFWHAKENGYNAFWNIDADDTFFCLDSFRLADLLKRVEKYCSNFHVHLANLDMWHSISVYEGWSEIPHWSFGVTYTDNTVDWLSILYEHRNDYTYQHMQKLHSNVDWYFTYLSTLNGLSIKSFYVENLKFIHYFSNFVDYPHKGTIYHFHNGVVTFPVLKYCFGLSDMGEIDIAEDDIKIDMNILDTEATVSLIGNSREKEVFAKEIKKIKTVDALVSERAKEYRINHGNKEIVFYGAGDYLYRNNNVLKNSGVINYICDSNPKKWGKEIFDNILCISPDELQKMDNIIVIIAVEQVTTSFEIARSLLKMGINDIDHIDNFVRYLLGFYS